MWKFLSTRYRNVAWELLVRGPFLARTTNFFLNYEDPFDTGYLSFAELRCGIRDGLEALCNHQPASCVWLGLTVFVAVNPLCKPFGLAVYLYHQQCHGLF